jgi:hypothetical protein
VCNIVHLIYRAKKYEGSAKDYEFSRRTMEEHWLAGHRDAAGSVAHREIFEPPDRLEGVRTFDFSSGKPPQKQTPTPTLPLSGGGSAPPESGEERNDERA